MNAPVPKKALSKFDANPAASTSLYLARSLVVDMVVRASLLGTGLVSYRLSWYRNVTCPLASLTATHGNHWSILLAGNTDGLSWFTLIGPVQLAPPLLDFTTNTSVSVLKPLGHAYPPDLGPTVTPGNMPAFALSSDHVTYRTSLAGLLSPSCLIAKLPADITRKLLLQSVCLPCPPDVCVG